MPQSVAVLIGHMDQQIYATSKQADTIDSERGDKFLIKEQNIIMRNFILGHSSEKAIATHTIVLVIMMGLFAMFAFYMFYKFSDVTNVQTTVATCTFKRIVYCGDWKINNYGNEPWNWEDRSPTGCGGLKPPINKPTQAECAELF